MTVKHFFLIDQANGLRTASLGAGDKADPEVQIDFQFCFPVDTAIFTLTRETNSSDWWNSSTPLWDMYNLLSIASSSDTLVSQSTYEYIMSQRVHIRDDICSDDVREGIIQGVLLCVSMLSSHLLSRSDSVQNQPVSQLAFQLRVLFVMNGIEALGGAKPPHIPGALVWCYAIGARFADQDEKPWFFMHFLRTCHSCYLENWEQARLNIGLVTSALISIQPLQVASAQVDGKKIG
jgi:hypothetical protein